MNIKIPANAIPAIATNILKGCLVSKSQARGIFLFLKKFLNSTTAENEQLLSFQLGEKPF